MVWKIEYWNGSSWVEKTDAWLIMLTQELNGHEELRFGLPNTSDNRMLVDSDIRVRLLWDNVEVWRGLLQAALYRTDIIECTAYVEAYVKMAKRIITQNYSITDANVILDDICNAAGVVKGSCPSENKSVRFKAATCLDAAKWLASACSTDFYADYNDDGNPRFNIGRRGRSDLVLDLHLDEGSGNTAFDSSRYGNHGTVYGASWVDGKYGKALSFDGVDDYVNNPNVYGLNRSSLTFTFWSKQIGTRTYYQHPIGIFGWHYATIYIIPNSYTYVYKFASINGVTYEETIATLDDQWHFLAVTFDGNQIKAYVDGNLKVTRAASGSITGGDESLFIGNTGAGSTPSTNWFCGIIDEVRIYNRALSPEEIQALYNAGPPISWPERGIDRSKVVDRVIVLWTDDNGVERETSYPSTGVRVAVVRDSSAGDADTAVKVAMQKYQEYSRDSSGVKLTFHVCAAWSWEPGDSVSLDNPELKLMGNYRIFKIVKKVDVVEVEVDKPQSTLSKALEQVFQGDYGITPVSSQGTSFPSNPFPGMLFYHTDQNILYRYDGSTWTRIVQSTGEGASFPSNPKVGDIFYHTVWNEMYRWNGTSWVRVVTKISEGTSFPSNPKVGDLFYHTGEQRFYRWNGSSWVYVSSKMLDDILDGTVYKRILAEYVGDGKPLVKSSTQLSQDVVGISHLKAGEVFCKGSEELSTIVETVPIVDITDTVDGNYTSQTSYSDDGSQKVYSWTLPTPSGGEYETTYLQVQFYIQQHVKQTTPGDTQISTTAYVRALEDDVQKGEVSSTATWPQNTPACVTDTSTVKTIAWQTSKTSAQVKLQIRISGYTQYIEARIKATVTVAHKIRYKKYGVLKPQ